MSPPGDDGRRDRDGRLVLVIEHEPAVAELARRYLARDGLTVHVAGTPADAVAALREDPPAVVVLDLTMPGLTAGLVRRKLTARAQPSGQGSAQGRAQSRSQGSVQGGAQPSGQGSAQSRGQGRAQSRGQGRAQSRSQGRAQSRSQGSGQPSGQGSVQGSAQPSGQGRAAELVCLVGPGGLRPRHVGIAGDSDPRCIRRPFSPRILVARVRAAIARSAAPQGDPGASAATCTLGELILDTGTRRARVAGADVSLTATEFAMLAFLAGNAGRVVSRQQLLSAVRTAVSRAAGGVTGGAARRVAGGVTGGAAGAAVSTAGARSVDVHIAQLRAKLGAHSPIRTIRGVGYLAEAPAAHTARPDTEIARAASRGPSPATAPRARNRIPQ